MATTSKGESKGRAFTGVVKSNKTDKTIVVIVQTRKTHPIYRKQYTDSRNFMAHDENNEAQVGDKVVITETRPLSAQKRFKLERIVETAAIRHTEGVETKVSTKKLAQEDAQ